MEWSTCWRGAGRGGEGGRGLGGGGALVGEDRRREAEPILPREARGEEELLVGRRPAAAAAAAAAAAEAAAAARQALLVVGDEGRDVLGVGGVLGGELDAFLLGDALRELDLPRRRGRQLERLVDELGARLLVLERLGRDGPPHLRRARGRAGGVREVGRVRETGRARVGSGAPPAQAAARRRSASRMARWNHQTRSRRPSASGWRAARRGSRAAWAPAATARAAPSAGRARSRTGS